MSTRPKIRAVAFDMGDILYDATGWRRWLAQHLQEEGVDIDYPRLVEKWEAALVPVYLGDKAYWVAFAEFLARLGVDDVDATLEMARDQGRQCSQHHQPFAGVAAGLQSLREANLALGVLSDTESSKNKVVDKLQRWNLDRYFDDVITSFDIRAVKPMPAAFSAIVEALGADTATTAFVGHDEDELEGAMQYGLFTVAFNYEPGVPADVHADSVSAMFDALLSRS